MRARVLGLVAAGAMALAGACARCPEARSVELLPAPIRERVVIDPGAMGVRVSDPSPPDGPVSVRMPEVVRVDSRVTWAGGEAAPVAIPMRHDGRLWTIHATAIAVNGRRVVLPDLRLDTGLGGSLSLSSRHAAAGGMFLVDEVPPGQSYTAFGPKPALFGVFGTLDLGPVEIAPIGAQVECGGPGFEPLLGLEAFATFGGVVFDWGARRLVLMPRGAPVDAIRALDGWKSARWTTEPVRSRRDSLQARGEGAREFTIDGGARWVRVTIGGVEHAAVLDTGFSADVFSFEPTGLGRDRRGWKGSGFGRSAPFNIADLDEAVEIGGVSFEGASILESADPPIDFAQRAGADLVIGLGILEQHPLWLDFERDEVRFWISEGALPDFEGVKVR
ncbi:MAG: hypothetical protein R3B49_07410 [Phycisphaerales bacterium]